MRKGFTLMLALLTLVWAQPPVRPELSLNAFRFTEGEALEVEGRGLEPDTTYELLLTSPSGEDLSEDLSSNEEGELDYSTPLSETGDWQIALTGEDVSAQFRFEVLPADAADTEDANNFSTEPENDLEADGSTDLTPPGLGDIENSLDDEDALSDDEADEEPSQNGLRDETALAQPDDPGDSSTDEPLDETATAPQDLQDQDSESTDAQTELDSTDLDSEDITDLPDASEDADTELRTPNTAVPDAPASDTDSSGVQADPLADVSTTEVPRDFTRGIESVFSGIARVGWYAVGALLLAMLALHITLLFKYWIPQSVILRRRAAQRGTPSGPLARLLAIRYYSFTEKLVLVIMFAVTLLLAALAGWNNPSRPFETWQDAVVATFSNPWFGLIADKPDGFSEILWMGLIVLFLAWLVFTVFWLFIPRPRLSKNAPRSALYNVFSVLVPGSGLADEMWGLLLIIPWAILGLDTLSDLFGWGIGIPALRLSRDYIFLGLIYLINLVAVGVEFSSYRRRMEKLKVANPELAEEFGIAR